MKIITKWLVSLAFGCCLISGGLQAASIQSLMIEEIGGVSGGLGISAAFGGGGFGDWVPPPNTAPYTLSPAFFVSTGSTDGALLMGSIQGNGQFTLGAVWNGTDVLFNTLHGAPSGSIENGIMSLNLSGLYADLPSADLSFNVSPSFGMLSTAVSAIDANHYYYTADWIHLVTNDVYHISTGLQATGWNDSQILIHMEGIATLAPIPEPETYAMMLAGLSLVGLMAHRRRKPV